MHSKKEVAEFLFSSIVFLLLLLAASGLWFTRSYMPDIVLFFSGILLLVIILLWANKRKIFLLLQYHGIVKDKYDNAITLIKIIALFKIVSIHFAWWSGVYASLFYFNGFMLRMFVIASGFGFTLLYLKSNMPFLKLLKHQMRKLYIAVALVLLFLSAVLPFRPSSAAIISYFRDALMVLLGLFVEEPRLLLNWLFSSHGFIFHIERYPATNGALWFISLVLWLYILHEPLLWLFRRVRAEIVLALLFISGVVLSGYFEFPHKTIIYNVFYFAFGIYFALHYGEFKQILALKAVGIGFAILTAALWFLSSEFRIYHYLFELFMFLSLYSLFSQPLFKKIRLGKDADRTILFVYLIHQPLIGIFSFLLWKNYFGALHNAAQYSMYLLILIGTAYLLGLVFKKVYNYSEHLF